jgi:hypothetical protein
MPTKSKEERVCLLTVSYICCVLKCITLTAMCAEIGDAHKGGRWPSNGACCDLRGSFLFALIIAHQLLIAPSVRNTRTCDWEASKFKKPNWLVEVVGCMKDWHSSMNGHSWSRMIEYCVAKHSIMLCTKYLCTDAAGMQNQIEIWKQRFRRQNHAMTWTMMILATPMMSCVQMWFKFNLLNNRIN